MLNTKQVDSIVKMGMDSYNNGEYISALNSFNDAIKLEPNNAKIWLLKSGVLSNLHHDTECINAYEKAISLDPTIQKPGWIL